MRCIFLVLLALLACSAHSQNGSSFTKFGKVTSEHLKTKFYNIDSNASAVVLRDRGMAEIRGNTKGWFSVAFKRHRIVHVLNKNGYHEADVSIPLYKRGDNEEVLEKLKAVTYTMENGKVVETKLEKGSIFKEKISENWSARKFTFPNVKEGSIIEYEYEVLSDYIDNLDPWEFQCASPTLWSEFTLSVPQFFSYAFLSHGYHGLHLGDKKDRTESFQLTLNSRSTEASERVSFMAGVTDYHWVMKDIPELKQENYASALKNHLASIEFQLASHNDPLQPRTFRMSWPALTKSLLEASYFGEKLDKDNNWLKDDVKPLIAGVSSNTEKAKRIFEFIRDNFTCISHNTIYASQTMKNTMKTKKGTVADINLLLTAMLRYADLPADPVLVSTIDHGYALEHYPMISSFNYVIAVLQESDRLIFLDASQPLLGFGKLMPGCYNGHARVVNQIASPVYLHADSVMEKKFTSILITNGADGKWMGSLNQTPGNYESYMLRKRIKASGMETFFKEIEKAYNFEAKLKNAIIDSLDRYEDPITIKYELDLQHGGEDIIYLNPLFGEGYKKNPFQAAQRYYPVEMPFTIDETFVLTIQVPEGYDVDEIPKQIIAKLDQEGSGYFEYRITHSGSTISMRTIIRFTKAMFLPDEYENLREFFNLIVNKHSEQIVFKKKK